MGDIGSRKVRFEVLPTSPPVRPGRVDAEPVRVTPVPAAVDAAADVEAVGATARTEPARR